MMNLRERRLSLWSNATCAMPSCEALSSRRGLGPHHAQKDRVGSPSAYPSSPQPLQPRRLGGALLRLPLAVRKDVPNVLVCATLNSQSHWTTVMNAFWRFLRDYSFFQPTPPYLPRPIRRVKLSKAGSDPAGSGRHVTAWGISVHLPDEDT